jgi:serralysin
MQLQINESAHWKGIDDLASTSPDSSAWRTADAFDPSWGRGELYVGESGDVTTYYTSGFDSDTHLFASTAWTDTVTDLVMYAGATPVWQMHGAVEVDTSHSYPGVNMAALLSGNDTIIGNSWDNKLEGFTGNDYVEGGGGTDTAVFFGDLARYTYTLDGSLIHTFGPDGHDTLVGISRLEFDDWGVAFDIDGTAGEAYRLYQAAFDRQPDLAGLGYQMHALDGGLALRQVAGNFVASPEFQSRYGALNNTQFVTQLYANVLDRAPDAAGLAYHVAHLNAGMSRGEVLVGFSESPENQANVIGQIDHGMLYLPFA